MEHRSFAPDIVVPNDDYACGNKRAGELAPDVAPEELRQEKQVGGTVNCSDSELCTFLLALEAGFLPTYYSDTNQSVQLKSMSIASRSYQHGKKKVVFHGSPSLQMSSNLTEDRGTEESTLFQAGSPAPTLAQPVKAPGSMAKKADSGWKWHGSFAKWDRDLCLWKTRQCSLLGDSEEFSGTWPRWGSMRNGECLELTTPVPRKNGNGSGLWPTPRANDGEKRGNFDTTNKRNELPAAAKRYMTPTASIGTKCGGRHNGRADTLASQIAELEGLAVSSTGKLNPLWVEWLMGWPAGWTDCAALETDRFREWLRLHGGF